MPELRPGSTADLPSPLALMADVRLLVAAVAASDIAVPGSSGGADQARSRGEADSGVADFQTLMAATGDVDGEVLRWIAAHVKPGRRLSTH